MKVTSKREYSSLASNQIKTIMENMTDRSSIHDYKRNMFELGLELGDQIIKKNPRTKYFYLVCTVEDADFLAKGIMQAFDLAKVKYNLACFWNSRIKTKDKVRISPVIRKYVEPYAPAKGTKGKMVIVKSLISGSCVVKTNIKEVIGSIEPQQIIVAAPVMHSEAKSKLLSEFDSSIVRIFDFFFFATDFERKDEYVTPGLGNVYRLLGLGSQDSKNRYTPIVVKERRTAYLT